MCDVPFLDRFRRISRREGSHGIGEKNGSGLIDSVFFHRELGGYQERHCHSFDSCPVLDYKLLRLLPVRISETLLGVISPVGTTRDNFVSLGCLRANGDKGEQTSSDWPLLLLLLSY